jgi:hypothetical protein
VWTCDGVRILDVDETRIDGISVSSCTICASFAVILARESIGAIECRLFGRVTGRDCTILTSVEALM